MNAPPGSFGPPPQGNPYLQPPQGNPYLQPPQGNPYAPPQAQGWGAPSGVSADGVPMAIGLYTANHVALATFLGTPLAGAALMAMNERRFGRSGAAVKTLLGGLVASGFLLSIGFILPEGVPTFPIGIGSIFAMSAIAKVRQGEIVQRHLVAGGKRASGWVAAGVGLLSLVAVLVLLVVVLVAAEMVGQAGR
jgi:hypothetical protein